MNEKTYQMVSCIICRKEYSKKGIFSHFEFKHNKENSNYNCHSDEAKISRRLSSANRIYKEKQVKIEYYLKNNPCTCANCNNIIDYDKRNNKFCTSSCAATFNNLKKQKRSAESLKKTSEKLKGRYRGQPVIFKEKFKDQIVGSYTRIYLCTCKISGVKWYSKTVKTISPNLKNNIKEYSYSCIFKFGLSLYPNWFLDTSKLIKEFGWYSTPGSKRNGISNINGISRDHLYSVHDGFKNGINPSIIRHPANCELKQHKENQTKNSKSTITIEELLKRIENFEIMYPNYSN